MRCVRLTAGAVFFQLHAPRIIATVFLRRISTLFAFSAGKPDDHTDSFFRHNLLFKYLGDDARADGQAALTDSKA